MQVELLGQLARVVEVTVGDQDHPGVQGAGQLGVELAGIAALGARHQPLHHDQVGTRLGVVAHRLGVTRHRLLHQFVDTVVAQQALQARLGQRLGGREPQGGACQGGGAVGPRAVELVLAEGAQEARLEA